MVLTKRNPFHYLDCSLSYKFLNNVLTLIVNGFITLAMCLSTKIDAVIVETLDKVVSFKTFF